ncbi:MAG TPA: hypothetical protein DEP88_10135, partial [Verrucomicrobiales bacterium]|nr:hypothetical protein [Verrucomicrobiales bacterium]
MKTISGVTTGLAVTSASAR